LKAVQPVKGEEHPAAEDEKRNYCQFNNYRNLHII
jgi:hypothetical protein